MIYVFETVNGTAIDTDIDISRIITFLFFHIQQTATLSFKNTMKQKQQPNDTVNLCLHQSTAAIARAETNYQEEYFNYEYASSKHYYSYIFIVWMKAIF